MVVTFDGKQFIGNCAFTERLLFKEAGFQWVPALKRWCTESASAAAKLKDYCDAVARKEVMKVMLFNAPWPFKVFTPTSSLGHTLKPYQIEGMVWALSRNRSYLAFDPGLGKTAIVAGIIQNLKLRNPNYETVYVCPPSLEATLNYELENWGVKKGVHFFPDSKIARTEVVNRIKEVAKATPNNFLIVDEAHRFNNPDSNRSKALYLDIVPHFSKAVFLSGTPMPNGRPMELFAHLNACAPEVTEFLPKFKFGVKYCAGHRDNMGFWNFDGASNVSLFTGNLKSKYMLRKKKAEVLTELPPKTEGLLIVGDSLPRAIQTLERKAVKEIGKADTMALQFDTEHVATYRRLLGALKATESIPIIEEILEDTKDNLLIFGIHKAVIEILRTKLLSYNPLVITGDTPQAARSDIAKSYQLDSSRRIFLGNIHACGLGFTLTKANRVLFIESSWVPADNEQAADRAHRIGQKSNVLVQHLVFKNSIDKAVIEANLRKKNVINKL